MKINAVVSPKTSIASSLLVVSSFVVAFPSAYAQEAFVLENLAYRIQVNTDGSLLVQTHGASYEHFQPTFTILQTDADPDAKLRPAAIPNVGYNVPTWKKPGGSPTEVTGKTPIRSGKEVGDGFDDRILVETEESRTANYFLAGRATTISATSAYRLGDRVIWKFENHSDFELTACIELATGNGAPTIRFTFNPRQSAWYSIGYTGAPAFRADSTEEIWQPLIWNEKRFPDQAYLTTAFRAPVPTAFVTHEGTTVGVAAASREFPYQPLPTFDNARFGILVRNAEGLAQPSIFSPVLGGIDSYMTAETPYSFEANLVVFSGDVRAAFEHVARTLFGFHDYRRNMGGYTLNKTIENMIEYAMSDYAQFDDTLKGSSYATDVPGAWT